MTDGSYQTQRLAMVREQLERRGISDSRLLEVFGQVPRELFVPRPFRRQAYADHPLPIGRGQTISQPYMVALMTQELTLSGQERVLDVGTGSGYQAAILAELSAAVYTVEWDRALSARALRRLQELGYGNVEGMVGDGANGWPERGPYDGILVAAAAAVVPDPLVAQLRRGGRLVMPIGTPQQQVLVRITKRDGRCERREVCGCCFVPLRGPRGMAGGRE